MPNLSGPDNGAPSGRLNGHDFTVIGKIFSLALAAFLLTWGGSVLVPWLQTEGIISAGVALMLTTMGAAVLRLINSGQGPIKLLILAVGMAMCSCGVSSAGDTAIVVPSLSTGSYLLTVDATGGVTLSPLDKVVRVNPLPPGPIPPTPGPLTPRAIQIRDEAKDATGDSARAETAQGLAKLFRSIASLTPQASSPAALEAALTVGLDQFMSSRGTSAVKAWGPVRSLISTGLTLLDFNKAPLSDYAAFFVEVANGLDASAPADKAISPQMLQLIEMILQIVLAMFKIPVPPLPAP